MQKAENDLAYFVIAFETALANGIQNCHCVFQQSEMIRQHLLRGTVPLLDREIHVHVYNFLAGSKVAPP